jgi:hypothetical protein
LKNRVILRYFWKSEDTTKQFLLSLLSNVSATRKTLLVSSVFLNRSIYIRALVYIWNKITAKRYNFSLALVRYNLAEPIKAIHVKNVWYTGENIRPPYDKNWDLLLTFENDETFNNNIFLPFWATTLGDNIEQAKIRQDQLLSTRNLQFKQKKFACAIISNPEPMRMRIIDEISKVGNVDLFGATFNKPISNKHDIVSEYYFNICFENDIYPNYVTEKLFESWNSGAVPIWWGFDEAGYINKKALINFYGTSLKSNLNHLVYLKENPLEILKISNEPILNKPYNYESLVIKINEYLKDD